MIAAFIILMTFVAAPATKTETYKCANQWCVDQIIEQAKDSTTLRRLRVFEAAKFGGTFPLGNTAFPAILDVSFD